LSVMVVSAKPPLSSVTRLVNSRRSTLPPWVSKSLLFSSTPTWVQSSSTFGIPYVSFSFYLGLVSLECLIFYLSFSFPS
jgi:hypothetical protein